MFGYFPRKVFLERFVLICERFKKIDAIKSESFQEDHSQKISLERFIFDKKDMSLFCLGLLAPPLPSLSHPPSCLLDPDLLAYCICKSKFRASGAQKPPKLTKFHVCLGACQFVRCVRLWMWWWACSRRRPAMCASCGGY